MFIIKNIKIILTKLKLKKIIKIEGGKSRQESTFIALKKIKDFNCYKVLIHDAARPNVSAKIIKNVIKSLKKNDAVTPVIKPSDAVKRSSNKIIFKNIERKTLRFSQTPQGFTFKKIYQKHIKYRNVVYDDDVSFFTNDNEKVLTINGSKKKSKNY